MFVILHALNHELQRHVPFKDVSLIFKINIIENGQPSAANIKSLHASPLRSTILACKSWKKNVASWGVSLLVLEKEIILLKRNYFQFLQQK